MCDLGGSINVIPLSIYKRLLGYELRETRIVIQLADRSCINPEGVLENVIVKVHDFVYPADFYVIKTDESLSKESSGVLLGRPFLRTAKSIIDMFQGTICLDYLGEKYTFNIDEEMKKPLDVESMESVEVIDPMVQEYLETEFLQDRCPVSEVKGRAELQTQKIGELFGAHGVTDQNIEEAIKGWYHASQAEGLMETGAAPNPEDLPNHAGLPKLKEEDMLLPSDMKAHVLELKTLPSNLKYTYLGDEETLPVIISNELSAE